nr:MAG TPA: hypothetical protein [Bacteriophage sp.]
MGLIVHAITNPHHRVTACTVAFCECSSKLSKTQNRLGKITLLTRGKLASCLPQLRGI